ncbi:MAG: metallophosphoesterase [Opitutaceae bacterium]|jgi:predicted phosphodiesterase|nr:metallophosphoesterase [Opitutaceae bacterium]
MKTNTGASAVKTAPAARHRRPPYYVLFIIHFILLAGIASPAALAAPRFVINADFEKGMPSGAASWRAETAIDTARAHAGRASLRISRAPKVPAGTFYFTLDGRLDFSSNMEFSLWIYTESDETARVYLSADDGSGAPRYTLFSSASIKPGQWNQVTGRVFAGDWRKWDTRFQFTVSTSGTVWIDDVLAVSGAPDTPAQVWPKLKHALHAEADKRVSALAPGGALALDATRAALAPDTAAAQTILPADAAAAIPAEGLLVFAIDAKADLDLTGSLQLEPDDNLRPGPRVTVLSDDTVIGVPSVTAAPWKPGWDAKASRPGPVSPDIRGERPPATVQLAKWRMAKGRHYITIAGPHIRPGGTFARLELRAGGRPADAPLYTFGLVTDPHLGIGRPVWANTKLLSPSAGELETVLRQLKSEKADFALLTGDMTDHGRRVEIEIFARAVKRANLPVYGVMGNHDSNERSSRADYASMMPKLFPIGPGDTDYTFTHKGLRFVILDGAHWIARDGSIQEYKVAGATKVAYREGVLNGWLRDTLAKDAATPAIVISHFPFYIKGGASEINGYDFGNGYTDKELMSVLETAPNVIATMAGHNHVNGVYNYKGITCLQTPAFGEWPNAYRVCRVYADRVEMEVRQFPNRGLIREGVVKEMAHLYGLSLSEGDLTSTISLSPRAPAR